MGLENIFISFEELRSSLFYDYPNLSDLDFCLSSKKFPKKLNSKDIKDHIFTDSLNNFWLSNSITRSSKLMCERNNISKKLEQVID